MPTGARVNLLYLISALFLFLSALSHFFGPLSLFPGPSLPHRTLLVAVASRLDRGEQRRAIRSTWKRLASPEHAELLFVSAERPCPIDPYWRIRDSACAPWNVFVPANVNERVPIRPYRVQPSLVQAGAPADGVGFKLKFPVSITQLGLSKKALQQWVSSLDLPEETTDDDIRHSLLNITVELLVPNKDDVQLSVNFSKFELDTIPSDDGFIYLNVREETYPRHFEGVLRVKQPFLVLNQSLSCNVIWNKMFGEDGILPLDTLWSHGRSSPFSSQSCPLVTLVYQIPDMVELKQVVNAKETQNKCQENKNKNLQAKLVEEVEDFDDLVFVNEVFDTEENVPVAMLKFFQWSLRNFDFDFIMVTDDDTFVAVDQVIPKLQNDLTAEKSWRGNFLKFSAVPHYGDGAEKNYKAMQYPIMPGERGSVLSKDLVRYLANNAEVLVPFRTISASLAIWLAPVNPDIQLDQDWTIDNVTCSKSTVAFGPVQGKNNIKKAYSNYKACNKICSCSQD